MASTLRDYQITLANLMQSGVFNFSPDLKTISAAEYDTRIRTQDPADYELAWEDEAGRNIIEKCHLETNEAGQVDAIVYESTWLESQFRVFEYQITTVPSRIIIGTQEPEESTVMRMTYWVLSDGTLAHYQARIDDIVVVSTGILGRQV